MNPTQSPFPFTQPALKLSRRAANPTSGEPTAAPFDFSATQVAADLAALQEREANLREYEARLRAWQDRLDAAAGQPAAATNVPFAKPSSQPPFQSDEALSAAWEKFHRARALLEAEQNQLRDDRMAFRDAEANLREREAALEARETRLKERELLLTIAVGEEEKREAAVEEKPRSAIQRLTQAPWAVFKSTK